MLLVHLCQRISVRDVVSLEGQDSPIDELRELGDSFDIPRELFRKPVPRQKPRSKCCTSPLHVRLEDAPQVLLRRMASIDLFVG